ncbi:MAG TPA: MEDS domain-containing protein [Telluria sp.]
MAETPRHSCLGFTDEPYPEGTHICYLYNDEDERRQILPLFAQQALADGESFHYVADVPTPADLPRALAALDLTQAFKGPPEQIAAATVKEGYFPDGSFEPDAMLARLRAAYDQCKEAGLNSARFAGEMTWALRGVPGANRILECETRINDLIKEAPMVIMCQYDISRFDGGLMYDVLNAHPVVIVGGHVLRNPFYQRYG